MRVTPDPSTITGAFHNGVADALPLKVPRTQMYVVRLFHLRVRCAVLAVANEDLPGAPQEFFVTVLGLVGGAPGGQTPRGRRRRGGRVPRLSYSGSASYVAGFPRTS